MVAEADVELIEIGKRMQQAAEEAGISAYDVAPRVDRRPPTICGWEVRRYRKVLWHTGKRHSVLLPRSEWVWAEKPGDWPAACTRAEWEAIQEILNARSKKPEWTNADGWCRDIVRFLDAPPGRVSLDTSHGRSYYSLRVDDGRRRWGMVPRDAVHAVVTESLLSLLTRPYALARLETLYRSRKESDAALRPSGDDREALRRQLAEKRAALERSVRELPPAEDEEIRAAYLGFQRELQSQIRQLSRRLQESEREAAPAALDALLVELAPVAADLPAAWAEPEFPPGVKRELARLLIDHVPVRMVVPPKARRQAEVGEPVWQEWTAELAETCREL